MRLIGWSVGRPRGRAVGSIDHRIAEYKTESFECFGYPFRPLRPYPRPLDLIGLLDFEQQPASRCLRSLRHA